MTASISLDSDDTSMEQSIAERFEKIAERHPDRLAVKHRDQALSYERLNAAANRIAYRLLHINGSKINAAALLFEQGIDVISAILGTLKTSARYCALDAQAPEERIEYILNDFQTDLILTNSLNFDLARRVAHPTRTIVVNIDEIAFENNTVNPGVVIAPDQIAAVVYTSGSTGHPRGVVRTHQRTTANVISYGAFRQLCSDDRISLTHPVSYASGDADLLMGLLNGAAVFPFDVRSEGIHNLAEWLKKERITIFHSSPSVFRELTGLIFPVDHFSDLRLIRLSGAPITQRDFDLYRTRFSARTSLEVGMGSTEAGAICNAVIGQDFSFPKKGSPVGYARKGKEIFIFDENGQVVPPGTVGEIAVKSRDFSVGYWRQPDLTERKYLRDSEGEDNITYLTGDLGTLLTDGFVIHLGRKDLTVKIRAYRVDISEVEHALLQHPDIKEAGVRAWDREEGEKYLAGYIVPRPDTQLNVSEIREFLKSKLPDYMIPTAVQFVEALPLTNGKLDRQALPKPNALRPALNEAYVAPRNETERKLSGIWSQVLQIVDIGIHDNFFDLGGNSIAGAGIITRLTDSLAVEISVSQLLTSPTVASLAAIIDEKITDSAYSGSVPPQDVPEKYPKLQARVDVIGGPALGARDVRAQNGSVDLSKHGVERSIPDRFEEIAIAYADRIAVKAGDRALTYRELNDYANRIAGAIVAERDLGSEVVALCFEHGVDVVAAILGVLKAGKIYVALDLTCAHERLQDIIEDCGATLILADDASLAVAGRLQNEPNKRLLPISKLKAGMDENLRLQVLPDAYACLSYTSGSTGKPKAVIETHRYRLHDTLIHSVPEAICADDTLSLVHRVPFASASVQLFRSLLNGASLVLWDAKGAGLSELPSWLDAEKITVLHLSPATFRSISWPLLANQKLPSLRLIHLSGAPLTRRDFDIYRKYFPAAVLLGFHMGATETGGITSAVVDQSFRFPDSGTPAGYPMIGKTLTLVDEAGKPVSVGQTGEIIVQSCYLPHGYWKREDITLERFLGNVEGGPATRYVTGDLASMSADGFIVHHGRKDLMVKVRGYRVELGEIERALLECPGVAEAAAAAWDGDSGDKYLVGYVVTRTDATLSVDVLGKHLREKFPEHMVPSTFVFLASMPLINGKVDRHALPRPDHSRPVLSYPFVAPSNEIEKRLAEIWAAALQINQIGTNDNFFDLGGHSLAAARMIEGVIEAFQLKLPVKAFLESPTVLEMAAWIRQKQSAVATESRRKEPMRGSLPTKANHYEALSIGLPREELEQSIPARFEKIVREYPHHPAVESDDEILTYAELNARSNRLARAIAKRAERNVHPVALLFGKGSAQIIAMLAVLKAGKFFVLIDPSFSVKRVVGILNDTGSELLLHDQETLALATQVTLRECQLLQPELMGDEDATENLGCRIAPNELAYVVYTSGSTGKPKGVMQNHQNILHRTMLRVRRDHISANDRFAHVSSGTSNEITNAFYTLLTGASMVVFDLRKKGVDRLARWLIQERITLCSLATPLFRKVCENLSGREKFHYLRLIGLGGDTILKSDVELFEKCFSPDCVLATALSSAETGSLTEMVIPKACEISGNEVPIGSPQPDKELYLVDESGRQVGFNQVGEIVVRSKYLSPGYWNRPELNKEKFKVDPQDPEQRIYYTGDLALMLRDGCLVHKGRKDFRVKIRGYGVEIAEVEKALRSHEAVKNCVIVDRKEQSGETKLVAYYVENSQRELNVSELRHYLTSSLPDYMVPSTFQRLDEIPLTPNGKVDRKALPESDTARPELSVSYQAPRTPLERRVAEFWAKTLSVDRVGRHDNFFDLGGHSISGSLVVSWIHQTFGMDLPVSEFFANPTVARLAERIEADSREDKKAAKKPWTYLCELQKGKDRAPVFVFPGGGGGEPEFFVYGLLARHVGTEYPFYGLRARGADGVLQPHTSVVQMADAYVEEIRSIQPKGPYYLIGECCGGVNAYEAACQLVAQGQEVAMLILMDVERPTPIKYLRYRIGKWLNPTKELLDATVLKWRRENYYLQRLPYHLEQLGTLSLRDYPPYLAGRLTHSLKAPAKKISVKPPLTVASRHEREEIVLFTMASGDALKHIERVRENYRRKVRRFLPQSYRGHVELIVSERLYRRNATLGWQNLVPEGLKVHPAPGDHWTYIREHVAETGLMLRECLDHANIRTRSLNG